ncbi:hypothetical protein LCGC14_0356110 [marine sediment metagenome]|uniref:VRR-NUC domain-containing protein n=1 Tax=marine sediment metagenome TaxID=412755 RepID=A0A0F9TF38_9ZZZZ
MKRRTKAQKIGDCFDAFKCIREGKKVKRSGAKDGSIATHPIVPVPELSERDVKTECLKWLKQRGIFCNSHGCGFHQNEVGEYHMYGIKNSGDIHGYLRNGVGFEIECKKGKGGRHSAGQQKRMKRVRKTNGVYFVIHGVPELEFYMGDLI